MNLLLDSRDLINLLEHSQPVAFENLSAFLREHGHEIILSFTNVRELVGTLAVNRDFQRVRPWLQSLEGAPHRYMRDASIPGDEIQCAVDAFNAGEAYRGPDIFVRRWDETLLLLPAQEEPAINQNVNVQLDEIVYGIYIARPAVFATFESRLPALQNQLDEDRRALRARQAPTEEHFIRAIRNHAAFNRMILPERRGDEFSRWIYREPSRCPGIQLAHEVYRALMENVGDIPEAGDFSDLAHVYALPYVQSATFDRRMRHYIRLGSERILARGGVIDYSQYVYENLATFMGRNL